MRELADADGKEIEISFALNQSNQDTQKLMEALGKTGLFDRLCMCAGDGIGMTALLHKRSAQVGFHMLSIDVERFELSADEMRQSGSDNRIENADPEHVARDREAPHFGRARELPEDDGKASDRQQRIVETDGKADG